MSDPWEQLRRVTLDQVVTLTKLSGSSLQVNGFTTPEGWPFAIIVAVAKPGNERAVELALEFTEKLGQVAQRTHRADNPKVKP